MPNTVQFIIGGYDYTPFVQFEYVNVNNNIVMTSDTMDLRLTITPGVDQVKKVSTGQWVTATRPICGQEIIWQNPNLIITAPGGSQKPYREFAGVITSVKEYEDYPNLVYEVHAKSYTHWLDRHLVVGYFNQDRPENIIRTLVNQFSSGFTTYNVQSTNVQVVPQYFDYSKLSDAIKTIADQLEYGWYVDYYKDIHFYALETFTSPLPNNVLDADKNTSIGDLELEENGEQQLNKIFIKGFKIRSQNSIILTFTGDGSTTQWSTGYRVSSFSGDVQVQVYSSMSQYQSDTSFRNGGPPTAGTTMKIKRDVVDGAPDQGGASNTAYIHYTQHLVRIPNFNGNGPVPSGYIIAVRFHYLKDAVWLAQDPGAQSITAKIEGTDGVYEGVVQDKSLTNSTLNAVKAKGELLLMKYKFPQVRGTFTTFFNATTAQGWRAGQYFTLRSKRRFGGIDQVMFVQRVLKSIVRNDSGGLTTFYNVEFCDSPYLV